MMRKRIMILEDDEEILEVMLLILAGKQYEFFTSPDCSVLRNIEYVKPHLILMDNRLLDGYGQDYCAALKKVPATADIPVVLVSASDNLQKISEQCGADAYLNKPFNVSGLTQIVDRFLQ